MKTYSHGTKVSYKPGRGPFKTNEKFTLAQVGNNCFMWFGESFNRRHDKTTIGSQFGHGIIIEQIQEEFGDLHDLLINGVPAAPDICPTCQREL